MPDRPEGGPAGPGRVVTEGDGLGQLPELLALHGLAHTEVLLVRGGEDSVAGWRRTTELSEVGQDGGPQTDHLLPGVLPADPGHGLQAGSQDDSVERNLVLLTASHHLSRLLLRQPAAQELRPPGTLRLRPQLRVQRRLPPGEQLVLDRVHHGQQVGQVEHRGGRREQVLHAAADGECEISVRERERERESLT